MSGVESEVLDDIVRLLAVLVRRGVETQREVIIEMSRAGLRPARIADLLGTTANTVNVTVQRARKEGQL